MNQSHFQKAAGLSAELAARWFQPVSEAMKEFGITKPVDRAMFIAQAGHESAGFTLLVESFNYRIAALVNFIRAGRLTEDRANTLDVARKSGYYPLSASELSLTGIQQTHGEQRSGDGWLYRGRGLIQITGLNNYRDCGNGLKVDLVKQPELLAEDVYAARSAAWFFVNKGCLKYSGDRCR